MEEKPPNNPACSIKLPPGFRFYPSDEELIVHYLRNKVTSSPVPASIIAEIDLYKLNPWDLPKKALFGEEEWYFFTPRDRKYANGARPNRAAASGYWKATGTDKPIFTSCGSSKRVGVKKALVFYTGRPPKGIKTDWIMNEYRILDSMIWSSKRKGSMRLDDWVLCRVRKKSGNSRNSWDDRRNYGGVAWKPEPFSYYLPNPEACRPKNNAISPNDVETIKSSLYQQGCPLLPYIFSLQRFPTSPNISFQQGQLLDFGPKNSQNYNHNLDDQEGNNNKDLESRCLSPTTPAGAFSSLVGVNGDGEEGKPIGDIIINHDSGFFQPYNQHNNNGEEERVLMESSAGNDRIDVNNYEDGSNWPQETASECSISSYLAGYEWNSSAAFTETPLHFY